MDCNHVFLRKRTVIGVAKKKDIPRPAVSQMHPRADLGSRGRRRALPSLFFKALNWMRVVCGLSVGFMGFMGFMT
jgi:hypothetical protein